MMLRHNVKLYERLKLEYHNSDITPSEYWKNYVNSICNEIDSNEKLSIEKIIPLALKKLSK